MQGVFAATMTELAELQPVRVGAAIFFGGVITLLAFNASEVDHLTNIFLSHVILCPMGNHSRDTNNDVAAVRMLLIQEFQ